MSQEWKLPNTRFHKIMNLFSLLLLLGMFLYTAIKWPSLPQTIATHFNFMGEADGWGGKENIWLMPVMSLLLYLLLTATTYFPGIWNVPGPVTAYNKNWIYRNVKNLLVFSKFVILLNFSYILLYHTGKMYGLVVHRMLSGTAVWLCDLFLYQMQTGSST